MAGRSRPAAFFYAARNGPMPVGRRRTVSFSAPTAQQLYSPGQCPGNSVAHTHLRPEGAALGVHPTGPCHDLLFLPPVPSCPLVVAICQSLSSLSLPANTNNSPPQAAFCRRILITLSAVGEKPLLKTAAWLDSYLIGVRRLAERRRRFSKPPR